MSRNGGMFHIASPSRDGSSHASPWPTNRTNIDLDGKDDEKEEEEEENLARLLNPCLGCDLKEPCLSDKVAASVSSSSSPRTNLGRGLDTVRSSHNLPSLSAHLASHSNSNSNLYLNLNSNSNSNITVEMHPMMKDAWENLRLSIAFFRGKPIGTIAAVDPTVEALNYNQVFVRDFVPSALAFLMNGETEIVKNFLLKTLRLQSWEKRIDWFTLGEGVMPASFKVHYDPVRKDDTMQVDFGEAAIGRVAPVDSGFWWIILLRAYTKSTGDHSLADMSDCQRGMRLILTMCLSEGFDTFPTLLCADGCLLTHNLEF